jgi:hypothetical protein
MVVSFRRCSDGLLHVRRFERITLLPTQAARPTSSAQPFRPTAVGGPVTFVKGRQDDILISEEVWASQQLQGCSIPKQRPLTRS